MVKKLIRIEDHKMIGGVCAGFADYLDIDISLVRILFVAVGIISAFIPMLLFYCIAWIVIPAGVKAKVSVKEKTDNKTAKPEQKPKK
ncbi:PspC domain-containing protein [Acidobacteriota bacterium]